MARKPVPLLSFFGLGNGNGKPKAKRKAKRKTNGETRYAARYLKNGGAHVEHTTSAKKLRHAVVGSLRRKGPRKVLGWYTSKAVAESSKLAHKNGGHPPWYSTSIVKVRPAPNGNGNGKAPKRKAAAPKRKAAAPKTPAKAPATKAAPAKVTPALANGKKRIAAATARLGKLRATQQAKAKDFAALFALVLKNAGMDRTHGGKPQIKTWESSDGKTARVYFPRVGYLGVSHDGTLSETSRGKQTLRVSDLWPSQWKAYDRAKKAYAARHREAYKIMTAPAKATPAIKAKAKKEAAKLPTPVSVAELVNQHGDTIQVAELKDPRARVMLTLKIGEQVKVSANNFPRGPMTVEAVERGKSMLLVSLASQRGSKKGKSYVATYHYPERTKTGGLRQYVPHVLLARGRATISKIVRYDPAIEDVKTYKGPKPGAKGWAKASDKVRMEYFRDALYRLAQQKSDDKAQDQRMDLILDVERPLERSYVCAALKEYGKVPKVRRLKVGDILYTSWGYDQTNVDFYQVVTMTAKSAKIRQVAETVDSSTRGSDRVKARKGQFLDRVDRSGHQLYPTLTKRIQYRWPSGGEAADPKGFPVERRITPALKITSYATAWLWDGESVHQTASGYGH